MSAACPTSGPWWARHSACEASGLPLMIDAPFFWLVHPGEMPLSRSGKNPSQGPFMKLPITRALGLIAALATVSIWAAFLLVTRFAVQGSFTVEEILVLRIVPGALVLAPLMWRMGVLPRRESWPRALILMVGASAVFSLCRVEGTGLCAGLGWGCTGAWHVAVLDSPGRLCPGPVKFPARAGASGWR